MSIYGHVKITLTSSCRHLVDLFGMDKEHNISLGAIDIRILQQKDFVYTILLKNGELDEETNWTSQVFADYQIFLPSDLE